MKTTTLLYLSASTATASSLFTPPSSLSRRDNDCDCYLTNGSVPEYYTDHRFFDFRSLSEHVSIPDIDDTLSESAAEPIADNYFKSDDWTESWRVQHWNNTKNLKKSLADENKNNDKIPMTNSFSNVYIQKNEDEDASSETFLTMRTKRLEEFQTAAEFESADEYHFASVRMLARTIGSPGAITALFTYRDGGSLAKVQEADIEILTRGPRDQIRYTNQPSYTEEGDDIPQATKNATIPGGREWSEWLVHRLDWTPKASVWYIDGVEAARIEFQTPRDPSQVVLNAWSDGGIWSGKMEVNDEAFMQIQWIDMVFNRTESGGEERRKRDTFGPKGDLMRRDEDGSCGVVCSVDEAPEVGESLEIEQNASSQVGISWLLSSLSLALFAASLF